MEEQTVMYVIMGSIVLNVLLAVVLIWQRKYLGMMFKKVFLRVNAREITVYHKNRTLTRYFVSDPKGFSWKKKFFSSFFANMPTNFDVNILPDTPYCRDTVAGLAQYEFHEDSNQCIDPYERQPDLYMKEADSNDMMNAFQSGELWNAMKHKSQFNMILLICVLAAVGVGVLNLVTTQGLADNFKTFADQAKPLLNSLAELIKAQASNPNGVIGVVK